MRTQWWMLWTQRDNHQLRIYLRWFFKRFSYNVSLKSYRLERQSLVAKRNCIGISSPLYRVSESYEQPLRAKSDFIRPMIEIWKLVECREHLFHREVRVSFVPWPRRDSYTGWEATRDQRKSLQRERETKCREKGEEREAKETGR